MSGDFIHGDIALGGILSSSILCQGIYPSVHKRTINWTANILINMTMGIMLSEDRSFSGNDK